MERQALALMDHPNIAKVQDVGTTDTGRPFFGKEWVRGVRLTDDAKQNHLGGLFPPTAAAWSLCTTRVPPEF